MTTETRGETTEAADLDLAVTFEEMKTWVASLMMIKRKVDGEEVQEAAVIVTDFPEEIVEAGLDKTGTGMVMVEEEEEEEEETGVVIVTEEIEISDAAAVEISRVEIIEDSEMEEEETSLVMEIGAVLETATEILIVEMEVREVDSEKTEIWIEEDHRHHLGLTKEDLGDLQEALHHLVVVMTEGKTKWFIIIHLLHQYQTNLKQISNVHFLKLEKT